MNMEQVWIPACLTNMGWFYCQSRVSACVYHITSSCDGIIDILGILYSCCKHLPVDVLYLSFMVFSSCMKQNLSIGVMLSGAQLLLFMSQCNVVTISFPGQRWNNWQKQDLVNYNSRCLNRKVLGSNPAPSWSLTVFAFSLLSCIVSTKWFILLLKGYFFIWGNVLISLKTRLEDLYH